MQSLQRRIKKMGRKGNIELVTGIVMGLMVFFFVVFAVLYGISTLNPATFFTAGSAERNATSTLQSNLTTGVSNFGQYIPTAFAVLAVVFILGFVVLLILYVRKMQMDTGGSRIGSY